MARINVTAKNRKVTHEGGMAVPSLSAEKQLRRSVMSCLLWENEFYEDGQSIADRIVEAAEKVDPKVLAEIAVEARQKMNLRHVPLLLLMVLCRTGKGDAVVAQTVAKVIQRADEMAELLAMHWSKGHKMVPAQMRKGLDKAFRKFDEYQLAKYDRNGAVKLRDVLRVVRPKPDNDEQSALWKRTKDRTLKTPDTWEVELSAGKDKKEVFERLIKEENLGYLALLRNLRNMQEAGVDPVLVNKAILARKGGAHRVFPFRFVAAARYAPQFEPSLDASLTRTIAELPKLNGTTFVLVDVSGSMDTNLSGKSDMTRMDAAAALASIVNCENLRVFTFSNEMVEVPPRKGMAGVQAIVQSQGHGGTYMEGALQKLYKMPHDRLIVISDEQAHDNVANPKTPLSYMINVGSYKNGVGYGKWVHIDGFSENVIRFIHEYENQE